MVSIIDTDIIYDEDVITASSDPDYIQLKRGKNVNKTAAI